MKIYKKILSYNTKLKNQILPISEDIKNIVNKSNIKQGTLFAYSLHTTMSLIIQEAVEKYLCKDIIGQLTKMIDDDGHKYHHTCAKHPSGTCKLDDFNGPSHVRQLITNQNVILDIENGKVQLGRWQDIALLELDGPRTDRKIMVKIVAE